jgi:hypothetical protein
MWSTGQITADSLYRLSNVEEWAPICQLQETLEALASSSLHLPKTLPSEAPPYVKPIKRVVHERIVEGDGSFESPFVIATSNHLHSAQIQGEIIDLKLGSGTYRKGGIRRYSESPRGKPGNSDICEHAFVTDGMRASVWFDLYLVTRLFEDPELGKIRRRMVESPQGQKLQAEIQKALGAAKPETEKKSSGCGFLIVGIVIFILYLIFKD